jgi:RimJ/RimL family protein N-acetyltransferase
MIYSRYGIGFHLLKEDDLEMVRQWRNDPVVANNYEFRDHITPQMQKEWFERINNINNLYTVIEYNNEKIGVINIKNIDWEKRVCEGGIFLPDVKYHNSGLPAIISYITTEIIFLMFEWNIGYAHVLKENKSVQQFVKLLGYELLPGQEEVNNQKYQITRESFDLRSAKIKKAIEVLSGSDAPGILKISRNSFSNPLILQWEDKVKTSRFIKKTEITEEGRFYYFS